jgi:hypothetical protein
MPEVGLVRLVRIGEQAAQLGFELTPQLGVLFGSQDSRGCRTTCQD